MAEAKIKARVLVATGDHNVNDVIEGKDAEAGIAGGWADGDAKAIAYAERERRRAARAADGE
jgi:hypothetical protein